MAQWSMLQKCYFSIPGRIEAPSQIKFSSIETLFKYQTMYSLGETHANNGTNIKYKYIIILI